MTTLLVAAALAADTRVFGVLVANMGYVQTALEALAKRAARKGLPALVWSWGKAETTVEVRTFQHGASIPAGAVLLGSGPECADYRCTITRVPLSLPCDAPKYAGWTFAAALQHLDGENIVRAVPGETVPVTYRSRGPACDHCKADRRRNDTYVLRHEDGRHVQVGSTCIGDFLGSDDAGKIAGLATLLADARSLAEGGCEGDDFSTGGSDAARPLSVFLSFVSHEMTANGWVSRTAARERGGAATADRAWTFLTDGKARDKAKAFPTDEDRSKADAALVWAESITDETINRETGDYLHNVRAIARSGLVSYRTAGIGGSIIAAYERAMGRARQQAERATRPTCNVHMGTEGRKVAFGCTYGKGKTAHEVLSTDPLTLDFVTGYESMYGYTTVLKFRTTEGALIVWKASNTEIGRGDVGKRYTLRGTIKKHDDYKGEKQTLMTRCTVDAVPEAVALVG